MTPGYGTLPEVQVTATRLMPYWLMALVAVAVSVGLVAVLKK